MTVPAPTTNLLSMPLVSLVVETGTNEDWVDSIKFLVDTGSADPPQLDLTGIIFEMEVRRTAPDHEVVISGSTEEGTLMIGDAPDFGYLIISIPLEMMKVQQPGEYVADIIGIEVRSVEILPGGKELRDEIRRRVIIIDLTIIQGVTR
jgi:hypothetical protein